MECTEIALLAVDWGSSAARLWALGQDGRILAERRSDEGALAVGRSVVEAADRPVAFEGALARLVGPILSKDASVPILACGMIGSSLGWRDAGYQDLPLTGPVEAGALVPVELSDGRRLWIVPGLRSPAGRGSAFPDVMRGEETQLIGVRSLLDEHAAGSASRTVILPGTHTKWVRMDGSLVTSFSTLMTGEIFALLRERSILAVGSDVVSEFDEDVYLRGVALGAAAEGGSVLAKVFSVRGLGLAGALPPEHAAAFLSGILIGEEIAGQLPVFPHDAPIVVGGARALTLQYRLALETQGVPVITVDEDITREGLRCLARGWGLLPAGAVDAPAARTGAIQ